MAGSNGTTIGRRARLLACVLLVASLLPAVLVGSPTAASSSSDTERYIVAFYEVPEDTEEYKGEPVAMVAEELAFFAVETDEPDRFRQEARQDDRVRYLEEDHRDVELAYTPNDPRFDDQYGPQVTKTDTAWDATTGSTAIKVGFLDSGIAEGHADLDDRVQDGWDYANDDGTPEDTSICGYHGSHVAGIASATIDNGEGIAGIAQHTVTMHKIFSDDGDGNCVGAFASTIADALTDLADKGAHVSSNSWTMSRSSSTVNEAIDEAHRKGVKHVAAAGNEGPCTDCVQAPWKDRPGKVIVVSCTDAGDAFCSFSSQGPEVDVAAPGYAVLSIDGGTSSGYTKKSGTSMSAPHVSGAVSLYIAEHGDDGFSTIEDEIVTTADDVGLSDERQGGGRLDVGELLTGADNAAPEASFTSDCHELNCTFDASDSLDQDGTITSYDWELGDGSTAAGETIDHTYDAEGDYTVTLTITDDDGASDQDSQTVSVQPNRPPSAKLQADCHELNCTFDASDSLDQDGTITSYDWELGDGSTAAGETVGHSYETEGDYTVTLTVTDDDGAADEATTTVSVQPNQPPEAAFTVDCERLDCWLDARGSSDGDGTIEAYDWTLGDGTTASGVTVDHVYEEEGEYDVSLTVTDDDGATDEATTTVTVVGPPETMHVHRISHEADGPHVQTQVWVYDEEEGPVGGVAVTMETCNVVDLCQRATEKTSVFGVASTTWSWGLGGPYRTCVVDLVHGELDHVPADDHAREGNCASDTVEPSV